MSVFLVGLVGPQSRIEFSDEPSSLAHLGGLHFQKRISSFDLLFLVVICLAELSGMEQPKADYKRLHSFICVANNLRLPTPHVGPPYSEHDAQARKHLFSQRRNLGRSCVGASLMWQVWVEGGRIVTESLGEDVEWQPLAERILLHLEGGCSDRGRIQSPVLDVCMGRPRSCVVTLDLGRAWYTNSDIPELFRTAMH